MKNLPFRTYLHHTPPSTREAAKERLELFEKLLLGTSSASQSVKKALGQDDEEMLWLTIRSLQFWGYGAQNAGLLYELCKRAIRDAESEGVIWTPVLDALADQQLLRRNEYNRARRAYENLHQSAPHSPDQPELPTEAEIVSKLIPWIEAQESTEALHVLLEFKASSVRQTLAEHVRQLDDRLYEELKKTPLQLSQNVNLPSQYRVKLAEETWNKYLLEARKHTPTVERMGYAKILINLASAGSGLPEHIRTEIIKRVRRTKRKDEMLIEALSKDVGASPKDIKKMLPFFTGGDAARVVRGGRAGSAIDKELLEMRSTAGAMLSDPTLELKWLDILVEYHNEDSGVLLQIIDHPNASTETLRTIARSSNSFSVQYALARETDPEIRRILSHTRDVAFAELLMPNATPEEYQRLFTTIFQYKPAVAVEAAHKYPPPPGTHLDAQTIATLCQLPNQEHRLKAIMLLERFTQSSPQIANPLPGSGRGRRGQPG